MTIEKLAINAEHAKTENCQIVGTHLGFEWHNILTLDLTLEGDGWGVGFGGYRMDGPRGMDCLKELLETLEVGKYEDLKGMYVRMISEGVGGRCLAIGHLLKDRWFSFEQFFNHD